MDELFKVLVALGRKQINATFELARASQEVANARKSGDPGKVYKAETAFWEAQAAYWNKTAIHSEKQLEQAVRLVETEGLPGGQNEDEPL